MVRQDCEKAGVPFDGSCPFAVARSFYASTLNASDRKSIDLDPAAPTAERLDLNWGIDIGFWGRFDIVINCGTTEHVFNQAAVFETIHNFCQPGGLMLHGGPWRGWTDHGFYNYQPTFFFDLAKANDYEMVMIAGFVLGTTWLRPFKSLEEIHDQDRARALPDECMLYCVLRRKSESPFSLPMQGIYSNSLTPREKSDWMTLRR